VRLGFPARLDCAGRLEPVQGRVQGPFLEPQQSAAGFLQAVEDLQAVSLAPLQRGQDHRLEMPTQLVALNRFHVLILDKLGISVKS
jgi:hypothetical protein